MRFPVISLFALVASVSWPSLVRAQDQGLSDLIDRYYEQTMLNHQARDALHLSIVSDVLKDLQVSETPLILFVAGPYGVGKSTLVSRLRASGVVTDHDWLRIDPDEIKSRIPEYAEFLKLAPSDAAAIVQPESVGIADRLGREALARGVSQLVDSSMRSKAYFLDYLEKVRARYPETRLGLVYLTADLALLESRVQARNQTSARVLELRHVADSLRETKESLPAFESFMDFVIEVSNRDQFQVERLTVQHPERMTEAGQRIVNWFHQLPGGCNPALTAQ